MCKDLASVTKPLYGRCYDCSQNDLGKQRRIDGLSLLSFSDNPNKIPVPVGDVEGESHREWIFAATFFLMYSMIFDNQMGARLNLQIAVRSKGVQVGNLLTPLPWNIPWTQESKLRSG